MYLPADKDICVLKDTSRVDFRSPVQRQIFVRINNTNSLRNNSLYRHDVDIHLSEVFVLNKKKRVSRVCCHDKKHLSHTEIVSQIFKEIKITCTLFWQANFFHENLKISSIRRTNFSRPTS